MSLLAYAIPFLVAAPAFLVMRRELLRGRLGTAIALMLLWALGLAAWSTWLSATSPELAARLILNADPYWQEMSRWLQTGVGRESDPARFLPQHVLHLVVFALLARYTGSALALPMGAALMHYMGYYVGRVAAMSDPTILGVALGWHPWAVIRVISFVTIGVVLSQPVLIGGEAGARALERSRPLLAAAVCGLILDAALKWMLAGYWRELIALATLPS